MGNINKKRKIIKPAHVHIRLTSKCNFNCRHCDIWKNSFTKKGEKELSLEQWKQAIDKIYDFTGPVRLDFAGGEILFRKDAVDVIKYATNGGFTTGLTTNAFFIDEEKARQLVDSGISTVNISLDGSKPETHNYIRNNNESFDRAKNAINFIRKSRNGNIKPYICIATVITEKNLDELIELSQLTNEDKYTKIIFQAMDQNFGAKYEPCWYKNSEFWPKDYPKAKKIINDLIALKKKGVKINNEKFQLEIMSKYFEDPLKYSKDFQCATGDKNLILDEFGNILLCWNLEPVGNILKDDVYSVYENKLIAKRRLEIKNCKRTCKILNCNFKK